MSDQLRLLPSRSNRRLSNAARERGRRGVAAAALIRGTSRHEQLTGLGSGDVDVGVEYDVEVTDVTGGEDGRSFGVNVLVTRRAQGEDEEAEELRSTRRAELSSRFTCLHWLRSRRL